MTKGEAFSPLIAMLDCWEDDEVRASLPWQAAEHLLFVAVSVVSRMRGRRCCFAVDGRT